MKKLLIPLGLILIIAGAVWKFGFSENMFNQRFPDAWAWEVNSIGLAGYPDAETGQFTEGTTLADEPISISIRNVVANADGLPQGQVLLSDHYELRDTVTSTLIWELTTTATVDSATGKIVDGEYAGDYYFLPRNVDKNTSYTITNTGFRHLLMSFQKEENIAGINTYLFGNYEPIDDTLANAGIIELEDGQEIWCFDFSLEYWVEPVTGEIVKFREWCEGDWVINADSDERLFPIGRWGTETTGDDLIVSAARVSSQLNNYSMMTLYLPLALVIIGVVLIVLGFMLGRASNVENADKVKSV